MSGSEKRRYARVPFDADTVLHFDGQAWPTDLVDISLKGLLVVAPEGFALPVGGECQADLVLNEDLSIEMHCILAHRTGDRCGLRIERIDMESLSHLRRLLELNLGDPEMLDRELSGLNED